jgi:hypothetical protein
VKGTDAERNNGYGNIYTPHAGSMIIQVQREGGLANRTVVLSQRQVGMLRFLTSPMGKALIALLVASWIAFAALTVRMAPLLGDLRSHDADTRRLDSLQTTLDQLQQNYTQLQVMLGAGALQGETRPDSSAAASNVETPPQR